MVRKITGWDINGRPFSESEHKKSWIRETLNQTYPQYLRSYARIKSAEQRKKQRVVRVRKVKRKSQRTNAFGFPVVRGW